MSYLAVATSSASDDWPTDPAVFAALAREFGPFDLDVCASPDNAKCPRFYTAADDGLTQPWEGRVFMNPPYGRTIGLWMRKARLAAADGALVVCLVPARPDTAWWRESKAEATLVRFYPGRLRFGPLDSPAPFPSALIVLGALAGRHGTRPTRCARCKGWFFPARADAQTCSDRCRQGLRRSRLRTDKRDRRRAS